MRKQGILRTAAAGVLALSLLVASAVFAADTGTEGGVFGAWTSLQSWVQSALGGIFGTSNEPHLEYTVAPSGDGLVSPVCGDVQCPGKKDGGGGDPTQTDTGPSTDPDG